MTRTDNRHRSDQITDETTGAFRADHLAELHAPTPPGVEAPSGFEPLPFGAAMLVVKRGPNAGCHYMLDRPTMAAGRDPGSDIFLDDLTVSRHHAEFRCETGGFSIVDTGSLNGTYVNRQPVDCVLLVNGDEVQIGNFRLVFLAGPAT